MKGPIDLNVSRRGFVGLGGIAASLMASGCAARSDISAGEKNAPIELDPEYIPSTTPEFAFLAGTWREMGVQLAEQFPQNILAATNVAAANAIMAYGTRDAAVAAMRPVVDLCDKHFVHGEDGTFTDFCKGIAETLGIDVDDLYFLAMPLPDPESAEADSGEGEHDCSAILAWGDATATGDQGVIAIMDADTDVTELQYMPALIVKPNNGITMCSTHGFYGSVVNAAGFTIESPGGSSDLFRAVGTCPHLWIACYCATVQEAVDFMGDPDGDPETWVPVPNEFNFMMGDAAGEALVYEVNQLARSIRRCHDTKYLSPTAGDEMPDEAGSYLITNNLFLTEGMLDNVLSNVRIGFPMYWDDVEPRYWTVNKTLSDAVANGGITLNTLVEAESEIRYFIPDDFCFDYYPDLLFGFWVPRAIYEQLDEDGGMSRADYYGERYDPAVLGDPMPKEESLAVEAWAPGWHEPSWSATPDLSTMGYWSPTPSSAIDKNSLRNVFDSNSRTLYLTKGSSDRLLSNQTSATGTPCVVRFCSTDEDPVEDEPLAMVENMILDFKTQLWIAAKDMEKSGADIDSADGKVLEGYVDKGKDALFQGLNFRSQGVREEALNKRLRLFSAAATVLSGGMCFAQLAQADPSAPLKDMGDVMVDVKNLE